IGGDAGNDVPLPPRSSSASEQVEKLAQGADVIVHSTIHPIMGPEKGSGFFPHAYFRQSNAFDLGALATCRHVISHAHSLDSAARSGKTRAVQNSRRPANRGGLQDGCRKEWFCRENHCRDRSRDPAFTAQLTRGNKLRPDRVLCRVSRSLLRGWLQRLRGAGVETALERGWGPDWVNSRGWTG